MMQSTFPLLSLAIWLPIAFGVFILAVGRDTNPNAVRVLSLFGSIVSFLVTLPIVAKFDNAAHGMQFVEKLKWILAGRRRPVDVVRDPDCFHHDFRRDCSMGSH
jgi:NADH-quinone oxidoreductase subunit M